MSRIVVERPVVGVVKLVMSDPSGRNALDDEMRSALADTLAGLYRDPSARAIVIGSGGRNFCTGGDLNAVSRHPGGQGAHSLMRSVNELALLVHASPKPIVAAVAGHCIGAGAGLALLCDLVVAGRSSRIGFPFLSIGVVADFGVSYSLPRRIGRQAARRALLESRSFEAVEAHQVGLCDYLVDDDALWNEAIERARLLAEAPAHALMQMRMMLKDSPDTLSAALEQEALNQAICFGSDDLREGLAAFIEKRRPDFARHGRVS